MVASVTTTDCDPPTNSGQAKSETQPAGDVGRDSALSDRHAQGVLPDKNRLMEATDERALKEIYDAERHLLYVAATRARERLWLSASSTASEFLGDLERDEPQSGAA